MAAVNGPVELDLEPKLKKGEVLLDSLVGGDFSFEKFARKKYIFYLQTAVAQFRTTIFL